MAYEVGYTVGLRHNFSGSFDALNYLPRYWDLRDDGNMAPRAWDPITQAEIDGRIREAQYSTVMDYGNNFVVTDSEGIGHYDHAAIKMGYGDLVEVFTNADDPGDVAWYNFIVRAGWPVPLKLSAFTGSAPSAYMYTDLPGMLGGIDRIQERADVPYTSLVADRFLDTQGIDDPLVDADGRPAVPYLFCSDEQADLNPDCMRYDAGADVYESIQSVADTYWNQYIFSNFRRERLGFNVGSYSDRVLNRYLAKLQSANQIYALYRGVFEDVFGGGPGLEQFYARRDGMGAWTLAVGASYQMLTRIVTAPEPGRYAEATRADGSRALVQGGFGGGGVTVDALDGRFLDSSWNFDDGYFWFDQFERAGYFYDKSLALQVLVDPQTNFLGRDTATDVRRYQISFHTTFGPSMTSLFRGILGEDWASIAPRAQSGELVYPDPLQITQGSMPGTPIDPNASFTIQLYAAVFGMSMIPDTYDQSFANSARLFVRGGAEGVELDPSVPTVEFTDPASGLTYVALSQLDGAGKERGVAAQMLIHAQDLQAEGATGALSRFIDNLNIVRRLSWEYGFGG